MNKVLLLTTHFSPGFRAGGILKACKNLVDSLSDHYEFLIITSNNDLGTRIPYFAEVPIKVPIKDSVEVLYIKENIFSVGINFFRNFRKFDIIHLNGFFNIRFSFIPLIICNLFFNKNFRVIVSVHGEFSPGALGLKSFKKLLFIRLVKFFRIYNRVFWHATNEMESKQITKIFPEYKDNILVAPYFNTLKLDIELSSNISSIDTSNRILKLIFLSRISPKKNLMFLLEILIEIDCRVCLTIIGPIEDKDYWRECCAILSLLPDNVETVYKGEVEPTSINTELQKHDLFVFPTLGENFGYVIYEALCAGTCVIVSDTTPWEVLENSCALNTLTLLDKSIWKLKILEWSKKNENELLECRHEAVQYIKDLYSSSAILEKNIAMYESVINFIK